MTVLRDATDRAVARSAVATPEGRDDGAGTTRIYRELPPRSIAVVFGTRPEIIKLSELLRLLGPAARIIYTGQHYDDGLGPAFFRELGLRPPDVVLQVGGSPRGQQVGDAVSRLDEQFAADMPIAVIVHGDTNATLAGALAANARGIPLVHIEAGLRSYDRAMPEEHNRVMVDHLSDVCCTPTEASRANLAAEGIDGARVVVTGNTVVEALQRLLPPPEARARLLEQRGLVPAGFAAATFHRPENVDDPERLGVILQELAGLPIPVVLPIHPRTAARIARFGFSRILDRLHVLEPLGYSEFLGLAAESALLVSDSGGIQEEASVLKRPVLVVRNSTERPEVMGTFAALVSPGASIGETARGWIAEGEALRERLRAIPCPYGEGDASERCRTALLHLVG